MGLWLVVTLGCSGGRDTGSMLPDASSKDGHTDSEAPDVMPEAGRWPEVVPDVARGDGLAPVDGADDGLDLSSDGTAEPPPLELLAFAITTVPQVGLSLGVEVTSNLSTTLEVRMTNLAYGVTRSIAASLQPAMTHFVTIPMMRAATGYLIEVELTDLWGRNVRSARSYTSPSLPEAFPRLNVWVANTEEMAPGLTLVSAVNPYLNQGLYFLLDPQGEVVFYNLTSAGFVVNMKEHLLLNGGPQGPLCLSTMLGGVSDCVTGEDFGVAAFHHLQSVTKQGHILALGLEAPQLSSCEAYDGLTLVGDVVVEFTPEGQATGLFPLMDALGEPLLCLAEERGGNAWDAQFPGLAPTKDRTHCNSVFEDPDDLNLVVSCHNVHRVVKLDRSSGALLWSFGPDSQFQMADGGRWSVRHHSAVPLPGGRVLLYDNQPAQPPLEARAVEYLVQPGEGGGTVTQLWEYSPVPALPSSRNPALGEVHLLENGNVLIVDSVIDQIPGQSDAQTYNPDNHVSGRISEVTYPDSDEVFQVEVVPPEGMPFGFWVVSALRLPNLTAPP